MVNLINIVIVGCGGHANSWKAHILKHPGYKLIGIVDTDTEKLEHVETWNVPEECAYPNLETAVKFSEEKIDVALITTPIQTHHVLATQALELGLHVILEKNMANTWEEGMALTRLARKHPELCTVMGTQYRYRPIWWTLKNLLTSKDCPIGDLASIRMKSIARNSEMRVGWRSWLPEIYPSDMMVHHIDSLRYCTDMEIVKVQATTFTPKWSRWLGDSTVFANFVLAPKGQERNKEAWVYCQYSGDWQGTGIRNNWEDSFEFFGKYGAIKVEPPLEQQKEVWEKGPIMPLAGEASGSRFLLYKDTKPSQTEISEIPKRWDIEGNPHNFIDQMFILDELANCIKSNGRKQMKSNFEDGYKSFLITRLAVESSKTGQTYWAPKFWLDPIPEP